MTELEHSEEIDFDDIDTLMEEEEHDTLTTKWLEEVEAYNMTYDSFYKDDVFSIKICKIYVNVDKHIERVSCERVDLEKKNVISDKEFAKLISNNNHHGKKKYRVFRAYLYNMDTDPDDLVKFIKSGEYRPLVREVSVNESLYIKETISQFQKLNMIYIVFKEINTSSPNKKATRKTGRVTFGSKTRKMIPKT
tara:strand:+ start:10356 stop:10934 length:579 start_codon:yes stop_codon:yes gene_type:complete